MTPVVKHIVKFVRQWGLKLAWASMVVALALSIVLQSRCGNGYDATVPPCADSLLCINTSTLQRIDYCGFTVYFNQQWHLPACVAYELTIDESRGSLPRAKQWIEDSLVAGCASPTDYVHSNYARGHIAPAGDMRWSEEAMNQSFTMTNVCPQNHRLNEGGWSRLEEKVREWVMRDSSLIVISGPIVTPSDTLVVGRNGVKVPGAFYKIILAHKVQPMRVAAFIYPNMVSDGDLLDYATTVRNIESRTGINFFASLPHPTQERLETSLNLNPWLN